LRWDGFVWRNQSQRVHGEAAGQARDAVAENGVPATERVAIEQTLRSLLRRFVSPEWIETRLGDYSPGSTDSKA
jgi:hypothetical protein